MLRPAIAALVLWVGMSCCAADATPSGEQQPAPDLINAYLSGQGSADDYGAVFQRCQSKAAAGDQTGETCLGFMYAHGNGVTEDVNQGIRWWRAAAMQEDVQAQNALGSTYEFGHGVPVDCAEAAKWYAMAADQGSPAAMYFLGVMAAEGKCRPRDDVSALAWLDLALANFTPPAASQFGVSAAYLRGSVAARISEDQLAQARQVEQDYHPSVHVPAGKVTVLQSFPTDNHSQSCSTDTAPPETIYPDRASRIGVPGHAQAACRISPSGRPSECTWTAETPANYGFGSAAARTACRLKFDRPESLPDTEWLASVPIGFAIPPPQ